MRQRVLLTVLVVTVRAAAWIGYIIDAAPTRPRPKSYRAAVMRMLDEQRIEYRDVEVVDGCAPSYQLCRNRARVSWDGHGWPNRLPRALDHM